ncbi:MAG: hypothetical protein H0V29_09255 [Thermoleophilaceae bacterium]|nr:hypothetical protein [Thermoleophilaceae bacterium]
MTDDVRERCAEVAGSARHVRIDLDAVGRIDPGPPPALDPERHYLEGAREGVALYVLTLDAINFGSGWFPTLRKRPGCSGYFTVAWGLAERFRSDGPLDLGRVDAASVAAMLGQDPGHELMGLFARHLRALGGWLGGRSALDVIEPTAVGMAESMSRVPGFEDPGFWKRAQIVPSDLDLAGVASFPDLDSLTIFADNLVPHVLRVDGVLVYSGELAAHIDSGELLPAGQAEREIRACAVHACSLIATELGMSERDLDNALWSRGSGRMYKAIPRHRTRTTAY